MICTTIEQSKKLLELGLDRKTSDMYYWKDNDGSYNLEFGYLKLLEDVPAWSLSSLLELMPVEIRIDGHIVILTIEKSICGYNFGYGSLAKSFSQWFIDYPLLDGAVRMVTWLLENNYIKNE